MGCFNGTCAVTNLPIEYKDEVVFFILGQKESVLHQACYSSDMCFPLTLPLRGIYDDYGGIKEIEQDIAADFFFRKMTKLYGEGKLTNPHIEKGFDLWRLLTYIDMGNDGLSIDMEMYSNKEKHNKVHLSTMFVLKTVYDYAINMFSNRIEEKLKEASSLKDKIENVDDLFAGIRKIHFVDILLSRECSYQGFWRDFVDEQLELPTVDPVVMRTLLEAKVFDWFLLRLNKSYYPQITSGQDTCWEDHQRFNDFVADYAQDRKVKEEAERAEWEK